MTRLYIRTTLTLCFILLIVLFGELIFATHLKSPQAWLAWRAVNEKSEFTVYVWDGHLRVPIGSIRGYSSVLQWSSDRKLVWEAFEMDDESQNLNSEIYVWDGEKTFNLSQNPGHDQYPTWSPDGRLSWVSTRDGNSEIFIWDGTHIMNVSQHISIEKDPVWSTDGQLAWLSEWSSRVITMWDGKIVMNVVPPQGGSYRSLMWSPDGLLAWISSFNGAEVWDNGRIIHIEDRVTKGPSVSLNWLGNRHLAWYSVDDFDWALHVWDGDGTQTVVIEPDYHDLSYSPKWLPDGRLFWEDVGVTDNRIKLWTGTQVISISEVPSQDNVPLSCATEEWFTWESGRSSNNEIFLWDGANTFNISQNPDYDANPSLSPDARLSWDSVRNGNREIYVWDGVKMTNISETPLLNDTAPVWSLLPYGNTNHNAACN